MRKKVLIIEDQGEIFSRIMKAYEQNQSQFEVFPKLKNGIDSTYNNWGHLMDTIRKREFDKILTSEFYKDVDLFVVDLTLLHVKSVDRIGVEFLNHLYDSNYRMGEFKFIICTRYIKEHIGNLKLEFNQDKQYVYKPTSGKSRFPEEVVEKSVELLKLHSIKTESPKKKLKFWETEFWEELPKGIEKNFIHRILLAIFYCLILATAIYALVGICWETIHKVHDIFTTEIKATEFLKYVEDMFLFTLPLFIVFSFVSYYKSTIAIKLTGGDTRDIDHDGAMKSLNNSKFILLSSLLSFTIIKIVDNLFEDVEISIDRLVSYGALLIILMVYILLQHRNAHDKKEI
ncbi:MAG TPA: hypothetical protein PLP23_06030 [Panacibacter sp.]|nr:hypothetical protein [Panacibacter sp.]